MSTGANSAGGDSRRRFLKKMAGAAAGLAGLSAAGASCAGAKPSGNLQTRGPSSGGGNRKPVVIVARDSSIWNGKKLDADKVKKLLFHAVRKFTGKDNDTSAWKSIFSGSERIGIKLNCISGRVLSTTPELASAIIGGLILSGAQAGNIVAWDRTEQELRRAGFTTGRSGVGAVFTGTDAPEAGYDRELTIAGEVGSLVSRIASSYCDTLVNAPVLKDHDLAGISGALKNYFGAINNPNKLHENGCDPYVADLNTMPVFKEKTRLIVMDGTTAQYHGGPSHKPEFAWRFSGIIVGTDPVAVDTVAWKLIEEKRKEKGLPTLKKEGREPKYIASAAHPSRALGENRLDKIQVLEI